MQAHRHQHLGRFQRMALERQPMETPATKQQLREELARQMEAFFARGGQKLELPQNAHAIDIAGLDVEGVHHLHTGRGAKHAPSR